MKFSALVIVLSLVPTIPSQAGDARIEAFFATQGCAIGPSTIAMAITEGIEIAAIESYVAAKLTDPKAVKTGNWLVLSPEDCEILPPVVTSEIRMSDPEVAQNLSTIDAYGDTDDIGCFLQGPELMEAVKVSRKWSDNKATLEYLRFLSASLVSGDLSFYSSTPLRTPPGFVVTMGKCADIPQLPDIKRSHINLIRHFDTLTRAYAADDASCDSGGGPSLKFDQIAKQIIGDSEFNAFLFLEISVIAMGAGWYEGMSATSRGQPRPPLCRYD